MSKTKLITLDQALELLNESFDNDPEKTGVSVYSKGTLYNFISSKRLTRYGPRHFVQLDKEEVLRVLGPKKVS